MEVVTVWLLASIAVCTVLSLLVQIRSKSIGNRRGLRLPPGPYPVPILGNVLQFIGGEPHRSLAQLSETYGPVMSLKVGSCHMVFVSSPEMAKEMLTKHDLSLSGRFTPVAFESCEHHKYSLGTLPVGREWRKFRKICNEQLFSKPKLEASQGYRQDKLRQLYDYVKDCCIGAGKPVNIDEAVFTTTLNLMSVTLFSFDLGDLGSDCTRELKAAVEDVVNTLGCPNLADFFPVLKLIDPQGIKRRGEIAFRKIFAILEDVIQQRLLSRPTTCDEGKNDMLEALLALKNGKEYDLSINDIKHLLLDLIVGGADLMASVVDWAMTELLLHSNKMAILKDELRTIIGKDKQVKESDISKLPYLRAVIKEVFRYHPPSPLLLPRKAEANMQVNGYTIPKDTQIFFNVWSMGRDPKIWSKPDSFEPERFLGSSIDFEGQHFELIPFGSGRRICPGMPLANRMLHLILAFLIHNFDWELEQGQEIDAREKFGLSLRRMTPLKAIPSVANT